MITIFKEGATNELRSIHAALVDNMEEQQRLTMRLADLIGEGLQSVQVERLAAK